MGLTSVTWMGGLVWAWPKVSRELAGCLPGKGTFQSDSLGGLFSGGQKTALALNGGGAGAEGASMVICGLS